MRQNRREGEAMHWVAAGGVVWVALLDALKLLEVKHACRR
jgi:hypothetical protein